MGRKGSVGKGYSLPPREAGASNRLMEGCYLLMTDGGCSPLLAQPSFLYSPSSPAHRGTAYSELGPPTSISRNQGRYTHVPTVQFDGVEAIPQ